VVGDLARIELLKIFPTLILHFLALKHNNNKARADWMAAF
jgi:hypothetical protein